MATKVKPNRMRADNTAVQSDALTFKDQSTFKWDSWYGDMKYADFNFTTKTWDTVVLDLSSTITPTQNFVVTAPNELKDWQVYLLRVTSSDTAYQMSLSANIQNPFGVDLTLTPNRIDLFVFLAVDWHLELQPGVDYFFLWTWNLTITQGGSTKAVFNANSSTNVNVDVSENELVDRTDFNPSTADNSKTYFIFNQ